MPRNGDKPLWRFCRHLRRNIKAQPLILSGVIVLLTLTIYWQTGSHGFFLYDDGEYLLTNPMVNEGVTINGIRLAFSSFHSGNWHPLTWLSHMVDVQLFGLKPGGHHLANLALHVANSLLLFLLLTRMTSGLWQSFAVTIIFAVHPQHVESVAWIAERKDLLSGLFFFLTLLAWQSYIRKPSSSRYLGALTLFSLGLMAKPMLVTLPCLLLLLDWWPFARFRSGENTARLFTEKVPFFLLALLSAIITYLAQNQAGAVTSFVRMPLTLRLANALLSLASYIRKMIWPHDLAVFYPLPTAIHWWQPAILGLLLAGSTMLLLRLRTRYPYLIAGWLWYLVMLVPVIGIIQVGAQAMADRYTYLPHIGLSIMLAWGAAEFATTSTRKTVLAACFTMATIMFTIAGWRQAAAWRSNIFLFTHALEVTQATPLARANLAKAYNAEAMEFKERWDLDGALHRLRIAASLSTGSIAAIAHNNMGLILAMQGHDADAAREYGLAIEHDPGYSDPYLNFGLLSLDNGRHGEAMGYFKEVLRLSPDDETARRYLKGME
jgi:tetratricopeptide (TPR) repeat protein